MGELTENDSSRFVQTKKWRLHYNEAGTGHPVVMLHGSGPGASGWSNFKSNLAPLGRNFRVLAIDMPGWGESDTATPDDRDHVEALHLFLDELGIEKAAIIGNSMGGLTALRFAVEHPDRISHLVPMGAPGPGPNLFATSALMSEGMRVLVNAYHNPTPANFKDLVSVMTYDDKFATDKLAQERSARALAHPEHLQNYIEAQAQGTHAGPRQAILNAQQQFQGIDTPTLIVHGRNDRTLPYENALRLLALIPDSRVFLLNHCGHWAQLEHAEEFNRVVAGFISSTPIRS